jgi:hypothetical protein
MVKNIKTLVDDANTLVDNLFAVRRTFLCSRVVATPANLSLTIKKIIV